MSWVNGDTVVLARPAFAHESPVPVLFAEVETGRVGDEELSGDPPGETEPAHDPESSVGVDVVVQDGRDEGTEFTRCGGETVGRGSDGNGVDLSSEQEGRAADRSVEGPMLHGNEGSLLTLVRTAGRRTTGSRWLGTL